MFWNQNPFGTIANGALSNISYFPNFPPILVVNCSCEFVQGYGGDCILQRLAGPIFIFKSSNQDRCHVFFFFFPRGSFIVKARERGPSRPPLIRTDTVNFRQSYAFIDPFTLNVINDVTPQQQLCYHYYFLIFIFRIMRRRREGWSFFCVYVQGTTRRSGLYVSVPKRENEKMFIHST